MNRLPEPAAALTAFLVASLVTHPDPSPAAGRTPPNPLYEVPELCAPLETAEAGKPFPASQAAACVAALDHADAHIATIVASLKAYADRLRASSAETEETLAEEKTRLDSIRREHSLISRLLDPQVRTTMQSASGDVDSLESIIRSYGTQARFVARMIDNLEATELAIDSVRRSRNALDLTSLRDSLEPLAFGRYLETISWSRTGDRLFVPCIAFDQCESLLTDRMNDRRQATEDRLSHADAAGDPLFSGESTPASASSPPPPGGPDPSLGDSGPD